MGLVSILSRLRLRRRSISSGRIMHDTNHTIPRTGVVSGRQVLRWRNELAAEGPGCTRVKRGSGIPSGVEDEALGLHSVCHGAKLKSRCEWELKANAAAAPS